MRKLRPFSILIKHLKMVAFASFSLCRRRPTEELVILEYYQDTLEVNLQVEIDPYTHN